MFACVCKAVTVNDVESVLNSGAATTMPAVQQLTGAATCCGRCGPFVRGLVDQARQPAVGKMNVRRYVPPADTSAAKSVSI